MAKLLGAWKRTEFNCWYGQNIKKNDKSDSDPSDKLPMSSYREYFCTSRRRRSIYYSIIVGLKWPIYIYISTFRACNWTEACGWRVSTRTPDALVITNAAMESLFLLQMSSFFLLSFPSYYKIFCFVLLNALLSRDCMPQVFLKWVLSILSMN